VPDESPALVAVAHGTRDPGGAAVVEALLERVRALRPGLTVRAAYVEITPPSLPDVLAALDGRSVVVPLLLAPGYHSTVDIPRAAAVRPQATVAPVLGPDPLLADALADRLDEAGRLPGDAVVLAAAGSGDPAATVAAEQQARMLATRTGDPVTVAYGSSVRPDVPTAVAAARRAGAARVAVAAYLLAPGFFATRLAAAGADLVSAPLGPHPAVVRLVLARYDAAAG